VLHLQRSWRWVLWTTLAFGWVLLCRYAYHVAESDRLVTADAWVLQAAGIFAWICTGLLPLALRFRRREEREPRWTDLDTAHWYGVSLIPPGAAILLTLVLWQLPPVRWGGAAVAAASLYGGAAFYLWTRDTRLARVLVLAASVLLTFGMLGALKGNAVLAGIALQALGLHLLAQRAHGGLGLRWAAHKGYGVAGIWLLYRLQEDVGAGLGNAVTALVVIACGLGASYLVRRRQEVLAYRFFAHVALLGFLWRELARVDGGEGFATVAWGAYALGLLLFGISRERPLVEKTALATLLVVVAKLFLVDLAALEAIYRILLFLGFGAVFLFFSYALQTWRRPRVAG
jgi:hypothetical protein